MTTRRNNPPQAKRRPPNKAGMRDDIACRICFTPIDKTDSNQVGLSLCAKHLDRA